MQYQRLASLIEKREWSFSIGGEGGPCDSDSQKQ